MVAELIRDSTFVHFSCHLGILKRGIRLIFQAPEGNKMLENVVSVTRMVDYDMRTSEIDIILQETANTMVWTSCEVLTHPTSASAFNKLLSDYRGRPLPHPPPP